MDFPDDVAFQTSNDLIFALSIFCAFFNIGERWFVVSHPEDGDMVWRCVGACYRLGSIESDVSYRLMRGWGRRRRALQKLPGNDCLWDHLRPGSTSQPPSVSQFHVTPSGLVRVP